MNLKMALKLGYKKREQKQNHKNGDEDAFN